MTLTSKNEVVNLTLTNVAFVSEASNNLLGTKRIVKYGYTVILKGDSGNWYTARYCITFYPLWVNILKDLICPL